MEVSLSHNGVSTLDTGILGRVYWDRTGAGGLRCDTSGRPDLPRPAGSLASYVSPRFIQANAAFVSDPGAVAKAYGDELRGQVLQRFWLIELGAWIDRRPGPHRPLPRATRRSESIPSTRRRVTVSVRWWSSPASARRRWSPCCCSGCGRTRTTSPASYAMEGIDGLSFDNPEALEIAEQVQPFIVKNTDRIRAHADEYEDAANASLRAVLPVHAEALDPRDGERIVIAEADPQGSQVGTRVRKAMYPLLEEDLGADAFAMRTISGDISSNGTVAEKGFVRDESEASAEITDRRGQG